jgi:hypothetical protein
LAGRETTTDLGGKMTAEDLRRVKTYDAIKTYRYLRVGMIGAVVLLAASIGIEIAKAGCAQTSISAYYYTPARSIFVGAMFLVGLSLIVYKGRSLPEDTWLNLAGMLAPVVAVAPTSDIGTCRSVAPLLADTLPAWVIPSIDNNLWALWIVGVAGLVVAVAVWFMNRNDAKRRPEVDPGTGRSLLLTAVLLAAAVFVILVFPDFVHTRAHGFAAIAFFGCLLGAIVVNVLHHQGEDEKAWRRWYVIIAAGMVLGGFIGVLKIFDPYHTFVLEAVEIALFAVYWIVQTVENWDEKVVARHSEETVYVEFAE